MGHIFGFMVSVLAICNLAIGAPQVARGVGGVYGWR